MLSINLRWYVFTDDIAIKGGCFMHAMVLEEVGKPLVPAELPRPQPQPSQVLVKILACGVCRTDLHVADLRRGAVHGAAVLVMGAWQERET